MEEYELMTKEELIGELIKLKEEYEYLKQDVEDNYKRVSIKEQIDYKDIDFIF